MKKILTLIALMGAAATLNAQSDQLPDCRQPNLTVGQKCVYRNTQLPTQVYLGDLAFPPDQHAHLTSPPSTAAPTPVKTSRFSFDLGGLFSVQSGTLSYINHDTEGYKIFATKQWSDWRGLTLRVTDLEYDVLGVSPYAGDNSTVAAAFGPNIQHSFGRVTPYGEGLIGALYQYAPGMSVSGVVGLKIRLTHRLSVIPAEGEYRWAALQKSTRFSNPERQRVEVDAGLVYHFGQ